ncbi:unnamed protein product [Cylindrotheca closterium]|uniref:Transcription activator GCR1-like domain-containing protein n=1 Tax=Cylindrotheca closterium TaxID=2856 RepID=A0AAD2FL24_9STRA|nr:unnamed protein product [Cylindrotheca closterium]
MATNKRTRIQTGHNEPSDRHRKKQCNTLFLENHTETMRRELPHAVEVQTVTVDTVLPVIIERLISLEQAVEQTTKEVKEAKLEIIELINNLKETIPAMMRETMLEVWQSIFSGMATTIGDMRSAAAAGATAPPPPPAMQQQTIPAAAANLLVLTERIRTFTFQSQHNSLKGLWDEWHGLGNYQDLPIAGGVAALEELHGAKWRNTRTNIQQRVSRQGKICLGIKKKSEAESKSIDSVCNEWNRKYAMELNKNMRRFVEFLQEENWIPVPTRRGRRSDT